MGSQTSIVKVENILKMFRLLLPQILVICLFSYTTNATITLACFSFPVITLPTFSLTGTSITSSTFAFLQNVGSDGSSIIDICGVGLLTYVTILVLPEILPERRFKKIASRLSDSSLLTEAVFVSGLEVRPDSQNDLLLVSPVLTGV